MKKIISIFSNTGELSSKRVFGGLGLAVIFGCYIASVCNHTELPAVTDYLFTGCVALLGCDSIVGAFTNK